MLFEQSEKIRLDLILLTLLAAVLLLWNLGTGSLSSWDEGLYGEVSREILLTGDWIDLHWAGSPWSDKPPLYMWATALFSLIFGMNEFSVRLFSALCGIGTVLTTYLLGIRLYSRRAGFSAALFLLSTWAFIWSSKMGMLDIPLTFFITLSLLLFDLGRKKNIFYFFCPVAFGLAFLTKGMGAMLIPMILLLYMIFAREFKPLKSGALWAGAAAGLIIAGWWHAAAILSYGEDFTHGYFIKHLISRTTSAVEGHTGDFFTYFGVIPNKGRPWAGIGLGLVPVAFFHSLFRGNRSHLLPLVWSVTVLLLFSVVRTKLHWYIMPLYPALSLLTGWGLSLLARRYTASVALVLCLGSVVYLGSDKAVFDLDYSPDTKKMASEAIALSGKEKELYLYGISDPGMQFYMGGSAENIRSGDRLSRILSGEQEALILTDRDSLADLPLSGKRTILRNGPFILIESGRTAEQSGSSR
ncbi:MAG: phospholipid carrier-dependent glycosyltransferase [Candidatus Omnitrophica bacterium]|nr:phospholipid carrier-dependent glycosyltransferase [Candidatus Omnitrophota bacterium]